MKIKRIKLSRMETLNVGEGESVTPKVELVASVEKGEAWDEVWPELCKMVDDLWTTRAKHQIQQVIGRRTNERDEETSDLMEEIVDSLWKGKSRPL